MQPYALLLCLGCLGATYVAAQAVREDTNREYTNKEVEITAEPHHHLAFSNQYLRVFNVSVDPNTETQMHWHRHDYIAVNLGPAELSNTVKDKPPVSVRITDGDVRFSSANFAHSVRAVNQPFRNVTIEILQDESLRNSAAGKIHWDEDRGLEVLDHGTKQILFVKDGIRVTEFELQPGAVVPSQSRAHPLLLVAVSDLDLFLNDPRTHGASAAASAPSHSNPGDSIWLPQGFGRPLINVGHSNAKFVTLELP